ncbi:hypothetical protein M422DRAFT_243234 [Sphaerobolus stellatus SS14]|nr:hypothetical protein M422DRAFT_243234 [Sphaerobolus stellatus SS14]
MASDANFEEATLNGKPCVRPEVIDLEKVHCRICTWRSHCNHFTKALGSGMDVYINDINEGALGSSKVIKQSYPKDTELALNTQQCYQWNKTGKFIKSLPELKLKFLQKWAHYLQSLKLQKNLCISQAEYDKSVVIHKYVQDAVKLEKHQKVAEILSKVQPIISLEIFRNSSLKNAD